MELVADSRVLYACLVLAVGVERLVELVLSRRNAAWAFERGGVEYGREHFPLMATLHTGFLFGAVAEVWWLDRPFVPELGWPALAVAAIAQALRYWSILTLGRRWNVRVIVVPEAPAIANGPYRWLRHPNYLAVIAEGLALPLVHTAWGTAAIFSGLNAWLLWVRIRCEERALEKHNRYREQLQGRAGVFPGL
ncbi:MAG: isoprenylcysteine carboxylmethyltransferase family protein [Myxococcota bacterium]